MQHPVVIVYYMTPCNIPEEHRSHQHWGRSLKSSRIICFRGLLSSVQHCADWMSSTDKQEPIQKCFRSLEYIFKFIIQSRLLFARATGGQYEDSFKKDLYNVFTALNKMLAMSSDVILPTQVQCSDRLCFQRFEILTAVSLNIQVFWDAVLCYWVWFLTFRRNTVSSEYWNLLVQWHSVTYWKTLIFRLWSVLFLERCDIDVFRSIV
jgi:hypothetical protein